jgi:hypothetical protein
VLHRHSEPFPYSENDCCPTTPNCSITKTVMILILVCCVIEVEDCS